MIGFGATQLQKVPKRVTKRDWMVSLSFLQSQMSYFASDHPSIQGQQKEESGFHVSPFLKIIDLRDIFSSLGQYQKIPETTIQLHYLTSYWPFLHIYHIYHLAHELVRQNAEMSVLQVEGSRRWGHLLAFLITVLFQHVRNSLGQHKRHGRQ